MLNVKCYTWLLYTANYFICVADGKIPRGAPQCFARGRTDGYEASGTGVPLRAARALTGGMHALMVRAHSAEAVSCM